MAGKNKPNGTVYSILAAISVSHTLNDLMQSLIVAIYPLLKADFSLSFVQVGLITLVYQTTASLLQPVVGQITDRKPLPYSLPFGMGFTSIGLLLLAFVPSFSLLLLAAGMVGIGSAIFHPESSRVARMAAGRQPGLAQSVFMLGGRIGSSVGPLAAAWFVIPHGRNYVAWFAIAALTAFAILLRVGAWYANHNRTHDKIKIRSDDAPVPSPMRLRITLAILVVLIFSKYFYLASIKNYYIFYLMDAFKISVINAEVHLFIFIFAVACGVIAGGPLGDKIGRKWVIWLSIFGAAPFTLLLPHVGLFWTGVLSVIIGFIIASALPAIIVYAQELVPSRLGMISGLFYGMAFGMGGIGAATLGYIADVKNIFYVYQLCAFLPLLGILALYLPDLR